MLGLTPVLIEMLWLKVTFEGTFALVLKVRTLLLLTRGRGKNTLRMLLHLSLLRDFGKILVRENDCVIKTGAMAKIVSYTLWEGCGVAKSVLNDPQHRFFVINVTNAVVNVGTTQAPHQTKHVLVTFLLYEVKFLNVGQKLAFFVTSSDGIKNTLEGDRLHDP